MSTSDGREALDTPPRERGPSSQLFGDTIPRSNWWARLVRAVSSQRFEGTTVHALVWPTGGLAERWKITGSCPSPAVADLARRGAGVAPLLTGGVAEAGVLREHRLPAGV
jgi:hypothetical protein